MKKLIVLVVAGLISVTASASNWVQTGESTDSKYYVDSESISQDKYLATYRTAFTMAVYKSDQHLVSGDVFNMTMTFTRFDCGNPYRTKALAVTARYNDDVISSGNVNAPWQINYPDSVGEATTSFVCSY